jgi:hypothetical protein
MTFRVQHNPNTQLEYIDTIIITITLTNSVHICKYL